MSWSLYFKKDTLRVAIFTSSDFHCLYDLLLRRQSRQFTCEIPLIISNYPGTKNIADNFGINFFEFQKSSQNREDVEKEELELLKKEDIDLVVLARYNRILSKNFIKEFPSRIINIHHSFLPAFAGRQPYGQAYRRGVKVIGATSHYVIEVLDAGPIIEQDVVRISHRDSLEDLKRKGEDLEKIVLSRAVKWHLERKILVYGNKTVVFD